MNIRQTIVLALFPFAIASCGSVRPQLCASGLQNAIQEQLYFGTEKPSGHVTPEEWAQFLSETVTPRFPQGLTVWQASGQWLSASSEIIQEPAYVLNLIHSPDVSYESAVHEIVAVYKARFQQEAVLQIKSHVCMGL